MADIVLPADIASTVGVPDSDPDVVECTAATVALVARYLSEPEGGWTADQRLGAKRLAIGLYRDKNTPGVIEQFGSVERAAYRRATDLEIEQLLRIGRYALPTIG